MTSTIEFEIDDDGTTLLPSFKHYIKALAKAYHTGHYFTGRKGKLIGDLNNQYDIFSLQIIFLKHLSFITNHLEDSPRSSQRSQSIGLALDGLKLSTKH